VVLKNYCKSFQKIAIQNGGFNGASFILI